MIKNVMEQRNSVGTDFKQESTAADGGTRDLPHPRDFLSMLEAGDPKLKEDYQEDDITVGSTRDLTQLALDDHNDTSRL